MQKIQKGVTLAIIMAEASHVFCCVLPTVVSIVSLLSGLGLVGALPAGMLQFHNFMHEWEVPVILTSGGILALGWGLYALSRRLDCHDTGCGHGPCTPKKKSSGRLLLFATALFLVNVIVYVVFHRGMDSRFNLMSAAPMEAAHEHDH